MRLHLVLFSAVLLLAGSRSTRALDPVGLDDDLSLRTAGLPADGPGLIAFFKNRTATQVEADHLAKLIEALGDRDEGKRTKAYQELAGLGPLAVPALRAAANDPDSTTGSTLVRQCLDVIQGERGTQAILLALRVLGQRRPEGSAEVLLAFAPQVENDEMLDEIKRSLAEVGFDAEGKSDPAIIKALADEEPARRALAAEVLGQRGAEPRETLRKLLNDPKGSVRLRAALALAQVREAKAVSTIIALLTDLPPNLSRDAEDFLANLAGEQTPKVQVGLDVPSKQKAREAWEQWWNKTEQPTAIDEIKKRTMNDARREQTLALIKKLGDENFKARLAAREELMKMGVVVVPLLRKASTDDTDPELKEKAKMALVEIEKIAPGSLSPVYPRIVAYRKPAGAVEALLEFLPFADDEVVLSEVQSALAVLAYHDGKPAPALLAALKDKLPLRRYVAAEALTAGGSTKELDEVRKLLKDSDSLVKLKTAIALANARDKDAVPFIIALQPDLPAEQASMSEEFLSRLAGDDAPAGQLGGDAEARKKRAESWTAWWKDKGSKTTLASLLARPAQERYLGFTMVISPNHSKIVEMGMDGKVRWELNGLSNVWDAQFITRNRLLVLESGARKVTERTIRGDVLWEMSLNGMYPTGMQRLTNGNMLFVSSNRMVEMTRAGREVFSFNRPNSDILHARKMKDGQIIYVTSSATVHRIDEKGNETKTWRVNNPTNQGCHVLPNGNIVFPQQYSNRVYEYDMNGQQVWTAVTTQPTAVYRLPNGHTLVGSINTNQLVELDRAGKEVWKVSATIQPHRVYRR
jgi:HEAT repeat protein